jgi:hypothetical protein
MTPACLLCLPMNKTGAGCPSFVVQLLHSFVTYMLLQLLCTRLNTITPHGSVQMAVVEEVTDEDGHQHAAGSSNKIKPKVGASSKCLGDCV